MSDNSKAPDSRVAASATKKRLKVVLCWHMHQPQYCDLISGEYQLPWTYLHGIKDYVDMAAHIEAVPGARAVVNFAPILLEQIADYAAQIQGFLQNTRAIRDPLLAALVQPVLPVDSAKLLILVKACLRVNEKRVINRFPAYRQLADMAVWVTSKPEFLVYLNDQFMVDLLVWYHLAWLGETVRREDKRVKALMDKCTGYSLHDRRLLLEIIGELLGGIIGRYAALAKSGQVELSLTPYAHPIVPLLLDLQSAREAMPDVPLPHIEQYPGGEARAHWHIKKGLETFEHYFSVTPCGCWPSEGGVSTAAVKLLGESGFRWVASGGSVMHNSLTRAKAASTVTPDINHAHALNNGGIHHPYHLEALSPENKVACFFRDDGLSDLIGFTYSDWHADDAVANLIHHLENIAATAPESDSVVSIILDGENAWEYYPENGYYFLSALYRRLTEHPGIELTTFSACLNDGVTAHPMPELVAGSWVYGTFSTWIGSPDKNRGWGMLGDAKRAFDKVVASNKLNAGQLARAEQQLAICEGSDWFWWFGDYNPSDTVSDFERLYRRHLANLYQMLNVAPPEYLSHALSHGGGAPQMGGVMRPGQAAS